MLKGGASSGPSNGAQQQGLQIPKIVKQGNQTELTLEERKESKQKLNQEVAQTMLEMSAVTAQARKFEQNINELQAKIFNLQNQLQNIEKIELMEQLESLQSQLAGGAKISGNGKQEASSSSSSSTPAKRARPPSGVVVEEMIDQEM
jgi:septal ring factor EnvC (AmiA/AmiB activator)